jgi:glycosyltransferase involved in cell wall biosynthesis
MKVLILSHMYPYASEPGFGLFVHYQAKELSRHCDVVVVSPTPWVPPGMRQLKARWARYASKPRQTVWDGITVYYPRYLNPPGEQGFALSAYFYGWAIRGLVARLRSSFAFDLIHAHTICPDGFAAARLVQRSGIPVLCTIHGSDINIYPHRTRLTRAITEEAIQSVDRIVTVCQALKAGTLELATPKREITVVPNGVDLGRFCAVDRRQARAELGLPRGGKMLLFASRLDEDKGLSYLLAALKEVLSRGSHCLLAVLGAGPYQQLLEREVAELGLKDAVILAGPRPHTEIATWMSACDLLVLPSLHEGSPLPIYEALACGRPVVATHVGGIPELITGDDYGLLVPPAEPAALAGALLAALCKEWDSERIREHGQQYTWGHVAEQVMQVYRETLGGEDRAADAPPGRPP